MQTLTRHLTAAVAAVALGLTLSASRSAFAQAVGPGQVLFAEFRLEGPGGPSDEYMELYCNRDTDCDLGDYNIVAFDPSFGDFATTLPPGTVIPARGYLLIGDDAGYSLNTYAAPDLIASFGGSQDFFIDNEGFQLRAPDQTTVIDSVGFAGGGGSVTYAEGAGLQRATGARPDHQYAYVRKMPKPNPGQPRDTNNNAGDFVLVAVTGATHPGVAVKPVLGAPGPQNLGAPVERNAAIPSSLIQPSAAAPSPPNRVRTGSGNTGTLSVRRSFTNNTGQNVTSLVFRVTDITTLQSPGYSLAGPQADLRLVSSGDAETFTNSQGRLVVVRGTALEFDDGVNQPDQPNGGGINSSVSVSLPGGALAPGDTVDVQFLLNLIKSGTFRFYVNVEAVTGASPSAMVGGARAAPPAGALSVVKRRLSPRRRFSVRKR